MAIWGHLTGDGTLDGVEERNSGKDDSASVERDHLFRCIAQEAAPLPTGGAATSISLEAEVPEALFEGMRAFIQAHPQWDQYRVLTSALAGFLFQNGCTDRNVAQHYLHGLFRRQSRP